MPFIPPRLSDLGEKAFPTDWRGTQPRSATTLSLPDLPSTRAIRCEATASITRLFSSAYSCKPVPNQWVEMALL